jgi:hypothetical protein
LCRLVMQTYRTNWITKDIKVQAKEKWRKWCLWLLFATLCHIWFHRPFHQYEMQNWIVSLISFLEEHTVIVNFMLTTWLDHEVPRYLAKYYSRCFCDSASGWV